MLRYSFIGSKESVKKEMEQFQKLFQVDEIMITSHIYEHEKRVESYRIFKIAVEDLNASAPKPTSIFYS